VAGTRLQPRIVTRQPHVGGEAATPEKIIAMTVDALDFSEHAPAGLCQS
jgi:hypothetical protein